MVAIAIAIAIAIASSDFPSFASRLQNILTLPGEVLQADYSVSIPTAAVVGPAKARRGRTKMHRSCLISVRCLPALRWDLVL
jgi:hypothetical protein